MNHGPIHYSKTSEGKYRVTYETPFFFGDVVAFDSLNGKGKGRIIDITLSDDGSVSYTILLNEDEAQGGVYPEEMRLIQAAKQRDARASR